MRRAWRVSTQSKTQTRTWSDAGCASTRQCKTRLFEVPSLYFFRDDAGCLDSPRIIILSLVTKKKKSVWHELMMMMMTVMMTVTVTVIVMVTVMVMVTMVMVMIVMRMMSWSTVSSQRHALQCQLGAQTLRRSTRETTPSINSGASAGAASCFFGVCVA